MGTTTVGEGGGRRRRRRERERETETETERQTDRDRETNKSTTNLQNKIQRTREIGPLLPTSQTRNGESDP